MVIPENCAVAFIGNTLRVRLSLPVGTVGQEPLTELSIPVDELGDGVWILVAEDD